MDCKHLTYFKTVYHTKVCRNCGLEVSGILSIQSSYTENLPLIHGYSRKKRFRMMLLSIVDPTRYCSMDGRTQIIFAKRKFRNIAELLKALKRAKSKNKQYSSVHLYAKKYVLGHVSPKVPLPAVVNDIVGDFTLVERGHHENFEGKQFFSYRWLLDKLLRKNNLTHFCPYVKKLQNKKSIFKYSTMYETIMKPCNELEVQGKVSMCEKLIAELPGDVGQHLSGSESTLSNLIALACRSCRQASNHPRASGFLCRTYQ